jgi:hypothetical protein
LSILFTARGYTCCGDSAMIRHKKRTQIGREGA